MEKEEAEETERGSRNRVDKCSWVAVIKAVREGKEGRVSYI